MKFRSKNSFKPKQNKLPSIFPKKSILHQVFLGIHLYSMTNNLIFFFRKKKIFTFALHFKSICHEQS